MDAFAALLTFTDLGGNLIGVADGTYGFTAGTTQTGTLADPLNPMLAPWATTADRPSAPLVPPWSCKPRPSRPAAPPSARVSSRAPAYDERGVSNLLHGIIDVGAVNAVVPVPLQVTHVSTALPLIFTATANGVMTSTFNVNSTADNIMPANGTLTLRAAINMANNIPGNKVIRLLVPGDYKITLPGTNPNTDANGAFTILPSDGNWTILNASGGAVTVDGNHLARVFDINPGDDTNVADKFTVTLQGFTITNGVAASGNEPASSGGGIRDQGIASLTLNNVVVTNNIATGDGGGISMENPVSAPWTLTINDSVISNNHAGDAGGGIETDGTGKVFINTGTVITGNTCVNQGAGIWLDDLNPGSIASVTITKGKLVNFTSPPVITFTAADGNGSGAEGIGILSNGTTGTLIGVNITNPGSGYDTSPTFFISPGVAGFASLTPLQSATLDVTGTLISSNNALTGPGGGIGNAGSGAVTITGSTIEKNFSGNTGGGFADQNNLGSLAVTTSLFLNNIAVDQGGGIQEGGQLTISSSEVAGNFSGNSGGGILASGATLKLLATTIAGNTAGGDGNGLGGGGIELQTTGTVANGDPSTITDCTITANLALNNAGANGGGIDAEQTGDVMLLNDTLNANSASEGAAPSGWARASSACRTASSPGTSQRPGLGPLQRHRRHHGQWRQPDWNCRAPGRQHGSGRCQRRLALDPHRKPGESAQPVAGTAGQQWRPDDRRSRHHASAANRGAAARQSGARQGRQDQGPSHR